MIATARRRAVAWKGAQGAYVALIYAFLFLPIVVLVLMSFNAARYSTFPVQHLTLRWYRALIHDSDMLASLRYSVEVALGAIAASVPLGTMAAYGLVRYRFRGKRVFAGIILVPLVIPGLLVGVSMLSFFYYAGIQTSLWTVFLAHTALSLPYTTVIIAARLEGLDESLEEAAGSLGATPWRTFRRVTLPLLAPGLLGAALFAFTISFGEIVVTFFVSGFQQTLPVRIWSLLKIGLTPEVNAVATVSLVATLAAVVVALRLAQR